MSHWNLPTLPLPHFQILPAANHLTIIHLNVRSYTAKLSDLQNDQLMLEADIVCFSKTWLSQQHPIVEFFKWGYTVFHCERNGENTKGGVLMSIPTGMLPVKIHSFSNGRLEAVTAVITLPWLGSISLSTIYQSPSLSLDNLLRFLDSFLPRDIPSVIVGDFNKNQIYTSNK